MNQENKNQNLFKKIQNFIFKNYIQLIISLVILLIIFIGFQTYNYFKIQGIKNSSINFFDIIQDDQNNINSLYLKEEMRCELPTSLKSNRHQLVDKLRKTA